MAVRIGKKLKKRAIDLGITNAEVARRIGVTERAYYNYTNDQREPNLTTLRKISKILDISLDELLDSEE